MPVTEPQTHHRARTAPYRGDAFLEAGVDTTVIALWLGHERVDTTAIYLHAHLGIKEKALARTTPAAHRARTLPPDQTRYWRSSKDSDYADFPSPSTPTTSGFTTIVGIIRTSG